MHVKSFLISDFPENAIPGILYIITHGDHTGPRIIINYSLHFRPASLKFDWKMKAKLRRLQRNISAQQTGDVADVARSEEVKSLKSLLYLRDASSGRYADVWLSVTISSDNYSIFKKSIDDFSNKMEFKNYKIHDLNLEQHRALDLAWIGGGANTLFERHHGRVLDTDAVSALYPFLDGSISDGHGSYVGHGQVDPSVDNMLKITNEARQFGTDPRLIIPYAPDDPNSKINKLVDNVHQKYIDFNTTKGTQIIFSDVGTPREGEGKPLIVVQLRE